MNIATNALLIETELCNDVSKTADEIQCVIFYDKHCTSVNSHEGQAPFLATRITRQASVNIKFPVTNDIRPSGLLQYGHVHARQPRQ
ncbi:hypothetical protein TDB9533_03755 [Thalassocella blandensis]|nr:hypothetical protein TDB9533_03755 [Thalassocella blandensis]